MSFPVPPVLYFLPVAYIMAAKFPPKDLLFARAYYFSFMGGWGFVLPFVNLFYVSIGLSGTQIGTVASLSAIVSLVISPFVVTELKKLPQARTILQLCLVLGAMGYFLLGQQTVFLAILIIIFFQTIATSAIMPSSDAMAVSVAQDHRTGYGSIRLWASVGWIIIVLSAGWLIEQLGYQAGFTGVAIMWTLSAGILLFIRPDYFVARTGIDVSKPSVRTALRRVLHDRTLIGFAVTIILVGFLNNGVLQFENVFLSQLGASNQLIAVAGILSAVVEVPFMAYADRFVRRAGAHRVMLIALIMISCQRAVVLLLPYIATIMIVRFVGGVSFSFYTISYVGLISSRTRASETGTVLALYTVTLAGLVNMLAAPISGSIFDAVGARWLYALAVAGYALGALILWLARPVEEQGLA
jgi:MFS transporter, PPP family, 3-phenylpropionic acid transporter